MTTKNKGGRPLTDINWETVDAMCAIQCTGEEIASVLGIHYNTLDNACKREKEVGFCEYYKKKCDAGKASLRRLQWKNAKGGNVSMQIWLGKQMLNQRDQQEVHHTKTLEEKREHAYKVLESAGIDPDTIQPKVH